MRTKLITFKEFKQSIFDYFKEHFFLKKHQLKRHWKTRFKLIDKDLGFYCMSFKFGCIKLTLNYFEGWWVLKKDEEILSAAEYIWRCCFFLYDPRMKYYMNKGKN